MCTSTRHFTGKRPLQHQGPLLGWLLGGSATIHMPNGYFLCPSDSLGSEGSASTGLYVLRGRAEVPCSWWKECQGILCKGPGRCRKHGWSSVVWRLTTHPNTAQVMKSSGRSPIHSKTSPWLQYYPRTCLLSINRSQLTTKSINKLIKIIITNNYY